MSTWSHATIALSVIAAAACGAQAPAAQPSPAPSPAAVAVSPAAVARADSGRPAYTAADVRFMQGMIGHHAQAILMARWAASHGAGNAVRTLAGRIDVSQQDEIGFMQRWLRERRETVPDPTEHQMMGHEAMPGGLMPGMLTPAELAQLDAARGAEFDRLFLRFMIRHHEGALSMVQTLFASPGAGQDIYVFRFASDVEADQTTEIARMRTMLGEG